MRRALLLVIAALALPACGYRLKGEVRPPAGIRRVHVPTFANKTYEPGLELQFTESLRSEFLKGNGVVLVTDRDDADAILSGEVLSFRAVPTVLVPLPSIGVADPRGRRLPTRYRAIVEVRVTLISVDTGEVLWEDRLEGTEEYDAGQAPEGFEPLARESHQQNALSAIAVDLMREAYDRMVTDF